MLILSIDPHNSLGLSFRLEIITWQEFRGLGLHEIKSCFLEIRQNRISLRRIPNNFLWSLQPFLRPLCSRTRISLDKSRFLQSRHLLHPKPLWEGRYCRFKTFRQTNRLGPCQRRRRRYFIADYSSSQMIRIRPFELEIISYHQIVIQIVFLTELLVDIFQLDHFLSFAEYERIVEYGGTDLFGPGQS